MIHNFNTFQKINESKNNFNSLIDYTQLKNKITVDDIKDMCEDAVENKFYAVCVLPEFVGTTQAFLDNTDVKVCTVISFHKGDDTTNKKVKDTLAAITSGADEIDMVMDYKKLIELSLNKGDDFQDIYDELVDDVKSVSRACHSDGVILKTVIEVEELTYNQIKLACEICVDAGSDFIQTSTGMAKTMKPFTDKLDQIKYMRKILPEFMKIKVTGGIRNQEQIEQVTPYVDRIGTSIIIE